MKRMLTVLSVGNIERLNKTNVLSEIKILFNEDVYSRPWDHWPTTIILTKCHRISLAVIAKRPSTQFKIANWACPDNPCQIGLGSVTFKVVRNTFLPASHVYFYLYLALIYHCHTSQNGIYFNHTDTLSKWVRQCALSCPVLFYQHLHLQFSVQNHDNSLFYNFQQNVGLCKNLEGCPSNTWLLRAVAVIFKRVSRHIDVERIINYRLLVIWPLSCQGQALRLSTSWCFHHHCVLLPKVCSKQALG